MSSIKQLRLNEGNRPAKKSPIVGLGSPAKTTKTTKKKQPKIDQIDDGEEEEGQGEPDVMSVAKSIVKIFTSSNEPDAGMPYQLGRAQPSTGSGFFISYNGQMFIITNAHVIAHFTSVHIKKYGSARKWKAQVLFVADTCDLAILTVQGKTFWRNVQPLALASPPELSSQCHVCGYPQGGEELSTTVGVVSRYGVTPYAHSGDAYISIQISAPINSGNSGGPVLAYNPETKTFDVVGVAFEAMMGANSIGYMISTTVVNNMLEQWRTNNPGCPSLNLITQGIESQVQRKSLFIPPLSGLLDYLYDMSQVQVSLLQLVADQQGVKLEDLLAQAQAEIAAQQEEAKDGEDKVTPKKEVEKPEEPSPTESELLEAAKTGEGDEMMMMEGEGDEQADHFIIGQDDEYDYVVFRNPPSDDEEEEEDDYEGLEDQDEDGEEDDREEEAEKETILIPKRSKSSTTPKSKTAKSPVILEEDEEPGLELELGNEDTPLYRIKRTSNSRPPPPTDLLPILMSGNDINDTQVGIIIQKIIPHTPSAELLKIGDVILAIDNIPISSDETVLFRENERVRYSFLTTNRQIGTTCSLLIQRGFDIFTVEVPIQPKAAIAPLFFHKIPQYQVALGLLFVPLSGNLLQAEFGEEWPSGSPVSLLQTLFMGVLNRFDKEEEAIVLTQILPHAVTEGYDQAMERLTHVNGIRIINMKHLSTVLNNAVVEYDNNKAEMDKLKSKMSQPRDIAASPQVDEKTDMADNLPEPDFDLENPAKFFEKFSLQLKNFAKVKYITFTLQSGQILTLSMEDGYKNQVEILKLHQIPFPGCSEALLPMYDMTVDLKFKNPAITQEDVKAMLTPQEPRPTKSAVLAQILSPTPLSPRESHKVTPYESKLYRSTSTNSNNQKTLTALEQRPELVKIYNDFSPRSPVEHLKKFNKNQKKITKKPVDEKSE